MKTLRLAALLPGWPRTEIACCLTWYFLVPVLPLSELLVLGQTWSDLFEPPLPVLHTCSAGLLSYRPFTWAISRMLSEPGWDSLGDLVCRPPLTPVRPASSSVSPNGSCGYWRVM